MLIEKFVRDYLLTKLNVPVYMEQPAGRVSEYVVFYVTDRGKENHINMATVEFSSYADSKFDAAELDQDLRDAMEGIVETPEIFASKFGGGNDDKDNELNRYRYRSYFNLYY